MRTRLVQVLGLLLMTAVAAADAQDFSLSLDQTTVLVQPGQTARVTLRVTAIAGFTGGVMVTPSTDSRVDVSPKGMGVMAGAAQAFTITVPASMPNGPLQLTFTGSCPPRTHTAVATIFVGGSTTPPTATPASIPTSIRTPTSIPTTIPFNQTLVETSYQRAFGRAPGPDEIVFWRGQLQKGDTRPTSMDSMLSTHKDYLIANPGVRRQMLDKSYQDVFRRPATDAEWTYWSARRDIVLYEDLVREHRNYLASNPGSGPTPTPTPTRAVMPFDQQMVTTSYQRGFGRAPSADELSFWRNQAQQNDSRVASVQTMLDGHKTYLLTPANSSFRREVLNKSYQDTFGRPATDDEGRFWSGRSDIVLYEDLLREHRAYIASNPGTGKTPPGAGGAGGSGGATFGGFTISAPQEGAKITNRNQFNVSWSYQGEPPENLKKLTIEVYQWWEAGLSKNMVTAAQVDASQKAAAVMVTKLQDTTGQVWNQWSSCRVRLLDSQKKVVAESGLLSCASTGDAASGGGSGTGSSSGGGSTSGGKGGGGFGGFTISKPGAGFSITNNSQVPVSWTYQGEPPDDQKRLTVDIYQWWEGGLSTFAHTVGQVDASAKTTTVTPTKLRDTTGQVWSQWSDCKVRLLDANKNILAQSVSLRCAASGVGDGLTAGPMKNLALKTPPFGFLIQNGESVSLAWSFQGTPASSARPMVVYLTQIDADGTEKKSIFATASDWAETRRRDFPVQSLKWRSDHRAAPCFFSIKVEGLDEVHGDTGRCQPQDPRL